MKRLNDNAVKALVSVHGENAGTPEFEHAFEHDTVSALSDLLALRAAVRAVIGSLGEHEGGSWDDPVAGPIQQALDQLRAELPE